MNGNGKQNDAKKMHVNEIRRRVVCGASEREKEKKVWKLQSFASLISIYPLYFPLRTVERWHIVFNSFHSFVLTLVNGSAHVSLSLSHFFLLSLGVCVYVLREWSNARCHVTEVNEYKNENELVSCRGLGKFCLPFRQTDVTYARYTYNMTHGIVGSPVRPASCIMHSHSRSMYNHYREQQTRSTQRTHTQLQTQLMVEWEWECREEERMAKTTVAEARR